MGLEELTHDELVTECKGLINSAQINKKACKNLKHSLQRTKKAHDDALEENKRFKRLISNMKLIEIIDS